MAKGEEVEVEARQGRGYDDWSGEWRKVRFTNSVTFPFGETTPGVEPDRSFHLAGMPGKMPQESEYVAGETYVLPREEAELWTKPSQHQTNYGVVNAEDLGPAEAPSEN